MGSARPGTLVKVTRFDFEFAPAYRLPALALGITPRTAWVEVDDTELRVRYGPWRLRTPLDNVSSAQLLPGPFRWYRTAGPPHLSLADKMAGTPERVLRFLRDLAANIMDELGEVAGLLDSGDKTGSAHRDALAALAPRFDDAQTTPSGRLLTSMLDNGSNFVDEVLALARGQAEQFKSEPTERARGYLLDQLVETSLQQQGDIRFHVIATATKHRRRIETGRR